MLKIPVATSQVIGLRSVMSRDEADSLWAAIPALTVDSISNWNKRYQENLLRIKSGDLYEVAGVIKSLMHRDAARGLSTGERKMLHNAKQIIISEIVLVEGCAYQEAEARLDSAMMGASVSA